MNDRAFAILVVYMLLLIILAITTISAPSVVYMALSLLLALATMILLIVNCTSKGESE